VSVKCDLGERLAHRDEKARRLAHSASECIVAAFRNSGSLLFAASSSTAAASGAVLQCAARPAIAASVVADFLRNPVRDRQLRAIPGKPRRSTLHSMSQLMA